MQECGLHDGLAFSVKLQNSAAANSSVVNSRDGLVNANKLWLITIVMCNAETRVCSKCKESKPFPASFHRAGLNRSGVITYRPDCADCHRALDRIAKRNKRAMHRPKGSASKHSRLLDLPPELQHEQTIFDIPALHQLPAPPCMPTHLP